MVHTCFHVKTCDFQVHAVPHFWWKTQVGLGVDLCSGWALIMVENRELWALHAGSMVCPLRSRKHFFMLSANMRRDHRHVCHTNPESLIMSASKNSILKPSKTKTMTSLSNCCSSLPSVSIHLLQIRLCFGVQLSITVHNVFQSFGSKFGFRSFLQLQHIGHMPMISQQQVAAILRRTETAAARHGGPEEQTTPGHFVGRVTLVLRR